MTRASHALAATPPCATSSSSYNRDSAVSFDSSWRPLPQWLACVW